MGGLVKAVIVIGCLCKSMGMESPLKMGELGRGSAKTSGFTVELSVQFCSLKMEVPVRNQSLVMQQLLWGERDPAVERQLRASTYELVTAALLLLGESL